MRQQTLKLTSYLPLNQLTSRHALLAQGFSPHTLDNYLKSGALEKVVKGIYMRRESKLNWQGVVASLANLVDEPVAVGGLTALELQGFAQYLPLNTQQKVHLYSSGYCPARLKVIFKQIGVELQWHKTARLWKKGWPEEIKLNEHKWHEDSASMQISTPEQAILEVLMSLPEEISFEHAEQLMQGLTQLSPRKLESLLQSCKSVKVKRLFFWFADRFTYPWCNKLNSNDYDLGSGKRVIAISGKLDGRFNITVPKELYRKYADG